MTTIRDATPADSELILRFIEQLADYEKEPDAVETDAATIRAQLAESPPPFQCMIAHDDDGEAAGFALFFHNYSTWRGARGIHLEDLFVLPERRGRGIGKALLQRLAAIAVDRGCPRLEWAVLDWNKPAIDFYIALGAEALDEWTTFRLHDEALERLAADSQLKSGQSA